MRYPLIWIFILTLMGCVTVADKADVCNPGWNKASVVSKPSCNGSKVLTQFKNFDCEASNR